MRRIRLWFSVAVLLGVFLMDCLPAHAMLDRGDPHTFTPVLLAAGDIANCDEVGDEATAALLDRMEGVVAALGDNAYNSGTPTEYNTCYDPTWGRAKARTRPAPGNHDYSSPGARPYYRYFGEAAGQPEQGYYSYDLAGWHIVVLNSNCADVGGCAPDSAQGKWLRADLEAHPAQCTLAYWHHPLFASSGSHGNNTFMRPIWQMLQDHGTEVILNGHAHNYERFAPQDAQGNSDPAGIREFVVGTGGAEHISQSDFLPNSEARNDESYGILRLTLHSAGYDWEFIPTQGETFTDSGSGACH